MCAAPGGKTTHLATLVGDEGEVVAVDLHDHRADSIRALAERTHTDSVIRVRVGDATQLDPAEIGTFDRVLLDAPCSGTGVLAARPDARWKRTEEGIDELVALQTRLLAAAATLVKPGGIVVYSTCSILREEDEAIAEAAPDTLVPDALPEVLAQVATSSNTARTWPQRDHTEGFFIARFRRTDDGAEAGA
jgi:16S rRNA (cytosine967-C5)-methyltransferase